jgi:hypothetical protein
MFKYVKEEDLMSNQLEQLNKINPKKEKEKEKKDNESEDKEIKEEEKKKNKSIEISINLIRLITNKANQFLDKNDIDQAVFEYYKNNDEFGKLFALMFVMDEIGILSQFSKYFSDRMDEFKEKKYVFDINGTVQDYSTEESQNRLREYVNKSEIKYYALIEGAYSYCITLKSIKIDDKRDKSKIIEDYENEESDGDGDGDDSNGNSKSNVGKKNNKEKKNRVNLDDEISEEEEEISEKGGKNKNKILDKDKEEEENAEGDGEDEEEDEEEAKKQKKNEKNKINSKKRKADKLKPKYKKSQTYKNKKK